MCIRAGKSQFSVDDLKEADTVEVGGTYKSDDRSPNGFELRLDTITILSEPAGAYAASDQQMETEYFA